MNAELLQPSGQRITYVVVVREDGGGHRLDFRLGGMGARLTVTSTPPYAAYQALTVSGFTRPLYVVWTVEPELEDAGVSPAVGHVLAESWNPYKVLFLSAADADAPRGQWQAKSSGTHRVRLDGKIAGLCFSSDVGVVETLSDQPGFDWSQRGQFALLFPLAIHCEQLPAAEIAKAIAEEKLGLIAGLSGYVRPGDDGDFLEIAFADESSRRQWMEEVKEAGNSGVRIKAMLDLDVDDIMEVNYSDSSVEVIFKDGTRRIYQGEELPEALSILNHWTPPTA